jgi:hypothetical protein
MTDIYENNLGEHEYELVWTPSGDMEIFRCKICGHETIEPDEKDYFESFCTIIK